MAQKTEKIINLKIFQPIMDTFINGEIKVDDPLYKSTSNTYITGKEVFSRRVVLVADILIADFLQRWI